MNEAVEMLTADDNGRAVEGPKYPRDLGVAKYLPDPAAEIRLAYRHKFFRYGRDGRPMPETLVEFYVPDYLCRDGAPTQSALLLVEERMGWTYRGESVPTEYPRPG